MFVDVTVCKRELSSLVYLISARGAVCLRLTAFDLYGSSNLCNDESLLVHDSTGLPTYGAAKMMN